MKKILLFVAVLLLLCVGAVGWSFYSYFVPTTATDKTVFIAPKTGARALLAQLHAEELVPAFEVIALPLFLTSDYHALKAGEYTFAAGMTPAEIIGKIVRGEVVVHKVTIPEGWNIMQVRALLLAEPLLSGDLPEVIQEGSILPDTMHFQRGEPRAAVLARMQKAQAALMAELWEKRAVDLPYQTPQEAIIMASIVERETGLGGERPMVAGVFINRLRIGMLLQTDPSVVYGIEVEQGGAPLGRALTRADLMRDTPYNTYTRAGLTPTPICNPGRKAIEAALNPAATDALYFVATGTGGHHFAATLAEHNANVAAYRAAMRAAATVPESR